MQDKDKTFIVSFWNWLIVKFIIWYIKNHKNQDISIEEDEHTLVIMNKEEYESWQEYKNIECMVFYNSEEELKEDFPNAVKKE